MMIRGYSIAGRTLALIAGILLIVGLAVFGLSQCQARKTAGKKAEVAEGQAGAAIDSGAEAMNTVGNVAATDTQTDALVAAGQAEIAAAAKGQKGAAAKRAACKMRAYRDTPQCSSITGGEK